MDLNSTFSLAKNSLLESWANFSAWRSQEKIVVIESDDWGSVRLPDRRLTHEMGKRGLLGATSRFDQIDCLETREDLELLLNVLDKPRNSDKTRVTMTMNTIMGNPDFDAIREDSFAHYHHESFLDSYKRYSGASHKDLWMSGIESNLIRPQFHGREHLKCDLWMRDLKSGRKRTRQAFDYSFYGVRGDTSSRYQSNYLAAFWAESFDELAEARSVLEEGLAMFEQVFGFRSKSLIPCNFIMPLELEEDACKLGVELIQGQRGQAFPVLNRDGRLSRRRVRTGKINTHGQLFSVRNVVFEPFSSSTKDWVGSALTQIGQAFRFQTPAIINTHRANFVGGIDTRERDKNLALFDTLLSRIFSCWPDVRFISSDQLLEKLRDEP